MSQARETAHTLSCDANLWRWLGPHFNLEIQFVTLGLGAYFLRQLVCTLVSLADISPSSCLGRGQTLRRVAGGGGRLWLSSLWGPRWTPPG